MVTEIWAPEKDRQNLEIWRNRVLTGSSIRFHSCLSAIVTQVPSSEKTINVYHTSTTLSNSTCSIMSEVQLQVEIECSSATFEVFQSNMAPSHWRDQKTQIYTK